MSAKSRGSARERQVADLLRNQDYFVIKAGGSLGPIDLLAIRLDPTARSCGLAHVTALLVQVKSDVRGPFNHFGPGDRAELDAVGKRTGGTAVLAWWPPRGKLRWFYPEEWPAGRVAA